jgi:hypothetical protein
MIIGGQTNAWGPNEAIPRWKQCLPSGRAEPALHSAARSMAEDVTGKAENHAKARFPGGAHSVRPPAEGQRVARHLMTTEASPTADGHNGLMFW